MPLLLKESETVIIFIKYKKMSLKFVYTLIFYILQNILYIFIYLIFKSWLGGGLSTFGKDFIIFAFEDMRVLFKPNFRLLVQL